MQEKRIRAQQSMKQLSKRMAEQRLKTLEHLRQGMTPKGKVRLLACRDFHVNASCWLPGIRSTGRGIPIRNTYMHTTMTQQRVHPLAIS